MPSPAPPSAREVLIESLGRLSAEEKERLHGPNWATFATQKLRSLRKARKWVYALSATMGLFAVAVPTTAFYHYYQTVESFSILGFLGLVAAACTFAAAQMGWAVHVYMNWSRKLQCYEGLRALGRDMESEKTDEPAATAT